MSSKVTFFRRWWGWCAGLIPVACLAPFLNKAFHIDDTVYLLVAEQIQQAPWDFFGFRMNWVRENEWVHEFNRNPPGISFYFAAVASIFGFREIPLHMSVLLPVYLAAVGIYRLIEGRGFPPLVASICTVLTPAFLVSSSNLMCEPFVLACYVWSVERWVAGTESGKRSALAVGATIAGLGVLMKFVGITVIPLLAAYSLVHHRGWHRSMAWLSIPIAVTVLYEIYVTAAYGQSALFGAAAFSAARATDGGAAAVVRESAVTLSFLGGAFVPAIVVLTLLQRWIWHAAFVAATGLTGVLVVGAGGLDDSYRLYGNAGVRLDYLGHLSVFIVSGVFLLVLATRDCYRRRDALSVLVVLWIAGITIFCGFVNWTINVRALLPMTPAIALLLARALADTQPGWWRRAGAFVIAIAGGALSVALVHFDARYANLDREAASAAIERLSDVPGKKWFQGHWGFQWYMESGGFTHIDLGGVTPQDLMGRNDLILLGLHPDDYCVSKQDDKLIELGPPVASLAFEARTAMPVWGATMNREAGAGFYDAYFGELPYLFAPVSHPAVTVHQLQETTPQDTSAIDGDPAADRQPR